MKWHIISHGIEANSMDFRCFRTSEGVHGSSDSSCCSSWGEEEGGVKEGAEEGAEKAGEEEDGAGIVFCQYYIYIYQC